MNTLKAGQLWQHDKTDTTILLLKSDLLKEPVVGETVVMWTCQWWNGNKSQVQHFSETGILQFWRQLNDV